MNVYERRQRIRNHFIEGGCIRPASVFDPVSARIATNLGFAFGMLGGSVASSTVLGAPDLGVITLTELAEQCRRITRASSISLIVDADNGYGNALNVMRTVTELEDAGVSGMTLEDTVLPQLFGHQGKEELIPIDEMLGKLQAAIQARQDPTTVLIGRTHALSVTNLEDAADRVKAYSDTGIDAIFLLGVKDTEQLQTIQTVTNLPLVLGTVAEELDDSILSGFGVKIALRGHGTYAASVKAIYESLKHQLDGGMPSAVTDKHASPELMQIATSEGSYTTWRDAFLSSGKQ